MSPFLATVHRAGTCSSNLIYSEDDCIDMTDPSSLRDATQIVLERGTLDGMRDELRSEFTVSLHETGPAVRIIGSPVEIKAVTRFLARSGVTMR